MINNDYKFIFVRCAKTGSTSIIENWYPGYITGTNKKITTVPGTDTWEHDKNHIPAYHIKNNMEYADFITYFKFAFVRNPYDRVVSAYRYSSDWFMFHEHKTPFKNFSDFVEKVFVLKNYPGEAIKYGPQWRFVKGCDFIGRYEHIQHDYNKVCDHLSIYPRRLTVENRYYPWRQLPKTREFTQYHRDNPQHDTQHYSKYYNDTTRNIVSTIFKQDIEMFNYSFVES